MKSVAIGFALAVFVLVVFFARSENYRFADGPDAHAYAADFVPDYVGAWILRHGDRSRLYDPGYYEPLQHDRSVLGFEWDAAKIYPLLYPPFYYAALTPLAGFEYQRAAQLWAGVLVLCWLAAACLAVRGLGELRPSAAWLLPASVIFPPVAESLASGQKGTLLLLLFAGSFALWRRGHLLAAGVVFGLVAFKPQLGIAIGLLALWKREWRFAAGAGASVGALLLLGAIADPGFPVSWLAAMAAPASESARYFHFVERNQCWFGFAELLLGIEHASAVAALTAALDAVTIGCLLWLWRGPLRPETPRFAV
ncbi:MAG TPA: glycosyltransferase family 87 protein, partial [Vicinamibacterales bacterium]|nr:glycosyltransferase family 87 protein [Vicinamibacterales bacterium]